jgi:hypothetical protein
MEESKETAGDGGREEKEDAVMDPIGGAGSDNAVSPLAMDSLGCLDPSEVFLRTICFGVESVLAVDGTLDLRSAEANISISD